MAVGTPNIKKFTNGVQPSSVSAQTLYTAPANNVNQPSPYATAIIKEIWLVNTSSSDATITIGINGVGAVNQLIPAQTVAPNTSIPISDISKFLSAGDTIQAIQGTASAITVHIDGVRGAIKMTIKSLSGLTDLSGGDILSATKKKELVNNYNSNLTINAQNKLGYRTQNTSFNRADISVVASAYDTSGNGGRKLVRLNDGSLVVAIKISTTSFNLYKSTDKGATWTTLATNGVTSLADVSITTNGSNIYAIATGQNAVVFSYAFKSDGSLISNPLVDSSQTAVGNCSLTINDTGTGGWGAWASKNATYPNSFNIRTASFVINGDGSATWGAVTQVTTYNTTGNDYKNPSIVIKNGNPIITMEEKVGTTNAISCYVYNGSTFTYYTIYNGSTYVQSSPSAIFVPQSINGLTNGRIWVAWHGTDNTSGLNKIRVSCSDDGGTTWSAMTIVPSAGEQFSNPSITVNKNNDIYIVSSWITSNCLNKSILLNGGSWSNPQSIGGLSTGKQSPSTLFDITMDFTLPLVVFKDSAKVGFYGTWTDKVEVSANPSMESNMGVFNALSNLAKDSLTETQKNNLLNQYNTNITTGIQNQLGYKPTYGATVNPSRSAVQVINSAYATFSNFKPQRLSNGWIVVGAINSNDIRLYISKDNGATFNILCNANATGVSVASMTSVGTTVYLIYTENQASIRFNKIDTLTQANTNIYSVGTNIDISQTALASVSIIYSPFDNTLHATWNSKGTYVMYNLRYAKGTIANDGSVGWGTIEQITTGNNGTYPNFVMNPCIVVDNLGIPMIFADMQQVGLSGTGLATNTLAIHIFKRNQSLNWNSTNTNTNINTTSWSTTTVSKTAIGVNTYVQSNPSATIDSTGAIHVVWHGLDATDTTKTNVRYSKSTDGGVTWSNALKLTSGNTFNPNSPSITCDQYNNLYVYFMGYGSGFTNSYHIRAIMYDYVGASWTGISDITSNVTGQANMQSPSLCDNVKTFTSPLAVWQDNVSPSVKFDGTWTDTPLIKEEISVEAVANRTLIDAIITKGDIGTSKKKWASGTVSVASGSNLTISGLTFSPSYYIITATNGSNLYRQTIITALGVNDVLNKTMAFYNGASTQVSASTITSITSNGLVAMMWGGGSTQTYTWVAYE